MASIIAFAKIRNLCGISPRVDFSARAAKVTKERH